MTFLSIAITVLAAATNSASSEKTRPLLALMPLSAPTLDAGAAEAISSALASELVQSGAFRVMERSQMDKILMEQGFQKSGACEKNDCAVEVGKILAVDRIIVGSLGRVGGRYSLSTRLVQVQSGEIVKSVTKTGSAKADQVITDLVPQVVKELAQGPNASHDGFEITLAVGGGGSIVQMGSDLVKPGWKNTSTPGMGLSASAAFAWAWSNSWSLGVSTGWHGDQFRISETDPSKNNWTDQVSLGSVQAGIVATYRFAWGIQISAGPVWNQPIYGSIQQNSFEPTLQGAGSLIVPVQRDLELKSATSGSLATSDAFVGSPWLGAQTQLGWFPLGDWALNLRGEFAFGSFYAPVTGTHGVTSYVKGPIDEPIRAIVDSRVDPFHLSSPNETGTYQVSSNTRGMKLHRLEFLVSRSFLF